MSDIFDVAVIGGGVIGLGMAGELAGQGRDVVLIERGDIGREASYASGGMVAPVMELESREPELLPLGRKSLDMFPGFCQELESETGADVGLGTGGTMYVGRNQDQQKDVDHLYEYQRRLGVEVQKLEPGELRERESHLAPDIRGGIYSPEELHVNNRRLTLALMMRCRRRGVQLRSHEPALEFQYGTGEQIIQCRTSRGIVEADEFIIAAGAWSSALSGLTEDDRVPVRPVKGQAVAVQLSDDFLPQHIIRTPDVYCVPHPPERLTIGATSEERGFTDEVTAGAVLELLGEARAVLPGLADQPLLETWAGFRPASRDNLPIVGRAKTAENLWYATGHYRSGILMLPATVRLLGDYMKTGNCPEALEPFLPERFAGVKSRKQPISSSHQSGEWNPC